MEKIFSLFLVALLLTACGVSEPVQETVEQLLDGSYIVTGLENASGNDESISLENGKTVWLYSVDEDGNLLQSFVKLTDAQHEKLQASLALMNTFTYPKLAKNEDGSMEIITVDRNGNPVEIPDSVNLFDFLSDVEIQPVAYREEDRITYPVLQPTDDGSHTVVLMSRDGTPVERTKTATKVSRFYSAEGKLQWTMAVTATFTYNGLEVRCSDVSAKVTIADPDNWYLISEETDGTRYSVCFGRTTLGVTTSAPTFDIALNCSRLGDLS